MKNNSAIIFARVSSSVQKPTRQISDLSKFANERGYDIKKVFVESGSGIIENDERPVLMEMLNYVVINSIKNVLITETSRLSRNISEIKKIILLFRTYKVNIFIQNININTLYEFDYSLLEESIRMANYEIKLMQSRLSSGLEEYRKNGGKSGRKTGYRKSDDITLSENENVVNMLRDGYSIRKIMYLTKKSSALVQKVKKIVKKLDQAILNEDIYNVIDIRADELYTYASSINYKDFSAQDKLLLDIKLNVILPYINATRGKTIIYTHYINNIDERILDYLEEKGFKVAFYTKKLNRLDREYVLDEFINGDLNVLVTSKSIVNGVYGLEKVSDRIIILSLPSTNSELVQLVRKINRTDSAFLETGIDVIIPLVSINGLEHSFRWDYKRYNLICYKETISYSDVNVKTNTKITEAKEGTVLHENSSIKNWIQKIRGKFLQKIKPLT